MESTGRNPSLKRSSSDAGPDRPPAARRPRFPKGKKVKTADAAVSGGDDGDYDEFLGKWTDPQIAAKERANRRNQIREEELFRDQGNSIAAAEVHYEESVNLEEDGIQLEPFNLKQEREEGYFDANGNYVEYANQNEITDAWLDSADVDSRFAEKVQHETITEDFQDLSSEDVGKIKRNIANLLEPRETIIQALRRLKCSSGDNRGKMTESTKHIFDQLTEDAMRLMENGEFDVYHEERETFVREAEGYERLARARDGILGTRDTGDDIFSDDVGLEADQSSIVDMAPSTSAANESALQVPPNDEKFDMFGDDDESNESNLQSDCHVVSSGSTQPTSVNLTPSGDSDFAEAAGGHLESDFVYDPSTGYYYSSNLGYYYDPASQLYCCATSETWYSFDANTGSYTEILGVATSENGAQGHTNLMSC